MRLLGKILAALYATAVAVLTGLSTAVDGHDFGDLTAQQWLTVVLAGLVAGGGVYGLNSSARLTTPKGD